jgi:hypothetical protein
VKAIKDSDRQLRDAMLIHLQWDPAVVSTDLGVTAEDGVVGRFARRRLPCGNAVVVSQKIAKGKI